MKRAASSPPRFALATRVLFGRWPGTEVKIDGEQLLILTEAEVLGIVDGGARPSKKKTA